MQPVTLRTSRLVLDQPNSADIDLVAEYCREPVFERYMVTPWPYERSHAVGFITEYAPEAWAAGTEATWAIRTEVGGPLLGLIGVRMRRYDIGYWMGAPHRRKGYMAEATGGVVEWMLTSSPNPPPSVAWECVVGNSGSALVARSAGFRFTGTGPSMLPGRDGAPFNAWHGTRGAVVPADANASWEPILGGRR